MQVSKTACARTRCAALIVLALAGCSDSAELLQARAARQEAQWRALELQDQVEAGAANYQALMTEFSDYQNDCKAKK